MNKEGSVFNLNNTVNLFANQCLCVYCRTVIPLLDEDTSMLLLVGKVNTEYFIIITKFERGYKGVGPSGRRSGVCPLSVLSVCPPKSYDTNYF